MISEECDLRVGKKGLSHCVTSFQTFMKNDLNNNWFCSFTDSSGFDKVPLDFKNGHERDNKSPNHSGCSGTIPICSEFLYFLVARVHF